MSSNIGFILGLAGSVMNSCLGHQHVLNVHFGSSQNGLVRSKHKDCVFVPPKSMIFPTLVWGSARMADQPNILRCVYSRFLAAARVDAEGHVVCLRIA